MHILHAHKYAIGISVQLNTEMISRMEGRSKEI